MELESLSSSGYSCRQSKCRATISPTSYRSPESARATRACTSAAWHKPTTERLWITKPKLGWGSTPPPEPDAHCSPPRKARLCTWQTRNQESPSHLWVTTAWAQIRRWTPRLLLTRPLIRINTPQLRYMNENVVVFIYFFLNGVGPGSGGASKKGVFIHILGHTFHSIMPFQCVTLPCTSSKIYIS